MCYIFVASDCFEIGRYAYEQKDSYHALLWLLESLAIYELVGYSGDLDIILLLDYLVYAASDVRPDTIHIYLCLCRMSMFAWFENTVRVRDMLAAALNLSLKA